MKSIDRDMIDTIGSISDRLTVLSDLLLVAIEKIPCTDDDTSKALGILELVYDEMTVNSQKLRNIE